MRVGFGACVYRFLACMWPFEAYLAFRAWVWAFVFCLKHLWPAYLVCDTSVAFGLQRLGPASGVWGCISSLWAFI